MKTTRQQTKKSLVQSMAIFAVVLATNKSLNQFKVLRRFIVEKSKRLLRQAMHTPTHIPMGQKNPICLQATHGDFHV
jgi:hypothetical protein